MKTESRFAVVWGEGPGTDVTPTGQRGLSGDENVLRLDCGDSSQLGEFLKCQPTVCE